MPLAACGARRGHPEDRSSRQRVSGASEFGGERGIRTLGRVSPTHAFQACSIDHSDISPFKINHLRAIWNSVTQNPPSKAAVRRCGLDSAVYRRGSSWHQSKLCKTSYVAKSLTVIVIVRHATSPHVWLFITLQALSEFWAVPLCPAARYA